MVDRSLIEERRERLRANSSTAVNGIDYVEIDSADKTRLHVYLVHPAPGEANAIPASTPPLTPIDLEIVGGDRIKGISVVSLVASGTKLTLTLSEIGDFSVYVLHINNPAFDRILSEIVFGFHAECPSDFDVCNIESDFDVAIPITQHHYLARDFDSYRQLMLDRMAITNPDWLDKDVPDLGITIVELMAYYADYLAYSQDVIATEGYLHTARMRSSIRGHAQLLGYDIFEGQSARLFVKIDVDVQINIEPEKLQFVTQTGNLDGKILDKSNIEPNILTSSNIQVFEPVKQYLNASLSSGFQKIHLSPSHNELIFHDWSERNAILPAGSTEAWFLDDNPSNITLKTGDFLLLEEIRDRTTKRTADADQSKRQIVRLVEDPITDIDHLARSGPVHIVKLKWHSEDALKFDLCVGSLDAADIPDDGPKNFALAAGNIVLADHGLTQSDGEDIGRPIPIGNPEDRDTIQSLSDLDYPRNFRPVLNNPDISINETIAFSDNVRSAASFAQIESARLTPSVEIDDIDHFTPWLPVRSLINATDNAQVFIAETEEDGKTYIRFSNPNNYGLQPAPGPTPLYARYRIGVGKRGNIGAEAIGHLIHDSVNGITNIRNPLPGFGGKNRESAEQIRLKAPRSIRKNRRAVTAQDYVNIVESFEEVQAARVREVWHGSWTSLFIAVDLFDTFVFSDDLAKSMLQRIEPYRLMGHDLVIEKPDFVPLHIIIHVCVEDGYLQQDVLRAVKNALSSRVQANGELGFFHNDNLTFGAPVFSSQIYEKVLRIDGVTDMKFEKFERWRTPTSSGIDSGILTFTDSEVPILMNDANFMERGILSVQSWASNS